MAAETKNAPARSGNSGEGLNDPNTPQKEAGTVMNKVTNRVNHTSVYEAAALRGLVPPAPQPQDECPSWCSRHTIAFDVGDQATAVHEHTVVVGAAEVVVSLDEGDPDGTVVWVPQLDWVNGQDLRDLIAAFQQAADIVDAEAAK